MYPARSLLLICLVVILSGGCAHRSTVPELLFEPPWKGYSAKIADLVDQKAHRSAFDVQLDDPKNYPAQRIYSQSMLLDRLSRYEFSEYERKQHEEWFKDSASAWLYNFSFQYSGILFFDAEGNLKHAILLG